MKQRNILLTTLITATLAAHGNIPEGQLVKIAVDHTGIHQITPTQLRQMGFESPDDIAVYGYGGSIDNYTTCTGLPQVATMLTDDGRILFYAEGPERYSLINTSSDLLYTSIEHNPTTLYGYYFIAPAHGASPRRISLIDTTPSEAAPLTTHYSPVVYHPMLTNPAHAGSTFLGHDITMQPDQTMDITFPTPDMAPGARLGLRLRGAVKASQPRINYTFNNSSRVLSAINSSSNIDDVNSYFAATNYINSTFQLSEPVEERILSLNTVSSGNVSYAAIESATCTYTRLNNMPIDTDMLTMYFYNTTAGTPVTITGATPGTTSVWDITDAVNTTGLTPHFDSSTLTVTLPASRETTTRLVAFNTDSNNIPSPTIIGTTTLAGLAEMQVPDMVIITAPAYLEFANRLAGIHRDYQSMDVAVVEAQNIYDEFSSGAPTPYAIRRFMKSLYDRNHDKLKHLIIMGAAYYDPCGRIGGTPTDDTHVLTYEIDDLYYQGDAGKCYCSDAFYAFLDDETLPDIVMSANMSINVGRIPVSNTSQADAYVSKVLSYISQPPVVDSRSHALIISDYGDNNGHLKQALALADSIEYKWSSHTTVTRAMYALFQRSGTNNTLLLNKITNAFNDGIGYIAYMGHGNPTSLTSDNTIRRSFVNNLSNTTLPLVMLSTCYTLGYDRAENSIAESFIFNPDGAAIAVIGSGRSVLMTYNQYLNLKIAQEYFNLTESNCLGDVFRVARNKTINSYNSKELTYNTASFNYAGDPALPLYRHTHDIYLDPATSNTISPLSDNTVKGAVVDYKGAVDTSFNGHLTLRLYNPAQTDMSSYDPTGYTPAEVTRRENITATFTTTITDGLFDTTFDYPPVTHPGPGHRLTFHAISDSGNERAVTSLDDVTVNDMPADYTTGAKQPPVIDEMYLDTPSFTDGDILNSNVTLHAVISTTQSALNLTNAIDHRPYINVDTQRHTDVAQYIQTTDSEGTYTLLYPITQLDDGYHTLTLSVTDNSGNRTSRTLTFGTITGQESISLNFDRTTANTEATLYIDDASVDDLTGSLTIENSAGHPVIILKDISFPFTWDLNDSDGNKVPDGLYTARARLKSDRLHMSTTSANVVVIKDSDPLGQ